MKKKRDKKGFCYIIYKFLKKIGVFHDEVLEQKIRLLGIVSQEEIEGQILAHRKKQIAMVLLGVLILAGVTVFSVVLKLSRDAKELSFERNSYGEGEKTESVYANGEKIEFDVGEQEYEEEEVEAKFEEAFSYADKNLLGDNESYDHITEDLNFVDIPDSGIEVSWMPVDYKLIDSDGRVQNQNFTEEQKKGVMTSVIATFSYGDLMYEREYPLCIYERNLTADEAKKKQLIEAIQSYEEKSKTSKEFKIPAFIQGFFLQKENRQSNYVTYLILTGIAVVCAVFLEDSRMDEKIKKRNEEILRDYPTFVNELVLYLGAGMTIRRSFLQISEDYKERREKKQIAKKYVYEEMNVMLHQLQSGFSQERAYYEFGQRLGLAPYIKLSSFIVQNLYQGSKEILTLLEQEEQTAFDERMDRARKAGEEAGTKLLFPMILLLIVVMILVMAPAMLQFRGI